MISGEAVHDVEARRSPPDRKRPIRGFCGRPAAASGGHVAFRLRDLPSTRRQVRESP